MKKKLRRQMQTAYPWWDEYYLLQMIEDWLRNSSKKHSTIGHLVRADRTAREMLIAANLIDRLNNRDYSEPNKVFPCRNKHIGRSSLGDAFEYNPLEAELRKQDLDYLLGYIKKHIFTWWD